MDMRWIPVILMTCFAAILLAGCVYEEYIYIEVFMPEGSPPVFGLSDSQNFSTPALVDTVNVYAYNPEEVKREFYWSVFSGRHEISNPEIPFILDPPIAVWKVVYGVVPDGFAELEEALPLEPNRKYGIEARGGKGGVDETVYFIYKPGQ